MFQRQSLQCFILGDVDYELNNIQAITLRYIKLKLLIVLNS
jgi:hypothetical protein